VEANLSPLLWVKGFLFVFYYETMKGEKEMEKVYCCSPAKEQYIRMCEKYNLIPVHREIVADLETPVSVYDKVFKGSCSCLLESVEGSIRLSRYSFIAGEPFQTLKASGEEVELLSEGKKEVSKQNFTSALRDLINSYRIPEDIDLPRFFGGAVGFAGYDTVRFFERLPDSPPDDLELPDACYIFPAVVLVFDHYRSRLKIIVNSRPGDDPEIAYHNALEKIAQIEASIINNNNCALKRVNSHETILDDLAIRSNIGRNEFVDKVKTIKQYIYAGDILQAVLSQRFALETGADPFEVYRTLRTLNPSPYMYYLDFGDFKIAGASPEMLARVEDGTVITRPIAGTRPRGETPEEDDHYERDLVNDTKEKAEHVMLVDLGRNDLGRVSEFGSIGLPVFMECERYSHVMHLESEVRGRVAGNKDAFDAFAACFPAGTVSGAPKVRAMEIINELEPTKRGPYAGAVGYFSFDGNMDTCITIRTVIFLNGKAYAQAGAGIVADSKPDAEYEETISKARVMLKALKLAGEER